MSITIGQPGNTTQATTASAGPGTADAAAIDAFNAQMGISPANDVALATDEQIAALPQSDVQRLREKWGADEAGFRGEAYELWLGQKTQDMIMQMVWRDWFKHAQEWIADMRSPS
jgi:hypothetical protein